MQDLNELIEQVADESTRYQHNQMQLQHSAWLLSQPPEYADDEDVPDVVTQVMPTVSVELPPMARCAPTNTVVAQTRDVVATEPVQLHTVVIMAMVAYATWNILGIIQQCVMKLFE